MPRLIDADDFVESLQKGMSVLEEEQTKYDDMRKAIIGMSISYIGATINSVAEMPTIDAVPVVRCKDCKHYDGKWCLLFDMVNSDMGDWFCGYGERKDGKENSNDNQQA